VISSIRRWRFPATPVHVAHARHAAAEYARAVGADESTLALAVSEAFTNAVVSHPEGAETGEIEMVAVRFPGEIEIRVRGSSGDAEPSDESASALRLGLHLIEHLTTRFHIRRHPTGLTELLMGFDHDGGAEAER
jgi:anti-sigma regulatory factor (Ser/Thr protein kinase)